MDKATDPHAQMKWEKSCDGNTSEWLNIAMIQQYSYGSDIVISRAQNK